MLLTQPLCNEMKMAIEKLDVPDATVTPGLKQHLPDFEKFEIFFRPYVI